MNRYILLIIILISSIVLTGCWSYKEINALYIVAGIAIDKAENSDKYNIATEFINIKDNKREQSFESILLETEGDSISDAVTKMTRISAKRAYWGHATTIIISEEVAREGIVQFLDLIVRRGEARLSTNIYISKEKSAKEVLQRESFSTDVRSFELAIMVNESKNIVKVPALKTYEVINALAIPKVHTVLPTVKSFYNDGTPTNLLSGGAVFSMGKLVGFLEEKDILPYLFIKDQVEAGFLNVEAEKRNPNDTITLEILGSNTKIKPIYDSQTLGFDISIKTDVTIGELTTTTDYVSKRGRERLKKLAQKSLEKKIKSHIEDVQKEFGFDIFGFGNIIRQRNPRLWDNMEKDWDSIFKDLDLNINCDIQIKNTGHYLKPLKVVE
ncbi:Ger(x)C family spore germination protein [Tissierella creatinophila]|uniref:Spore germination protein B3 n=1 Tax=Tissierella creatinophila DSM 6911 TaxID=1123403 RepID=A0A1U7M3C6_TISCR|nr:Ger(x)C family spore germination protein [Tissierella creatinophila]OLS01786.1 spore germination protein B3 precursor [Tissierella creatinophila DSM 6911]